MFPGLRVAYAWPIVRDCQELPLRQLQELWLTLRALFRIHEEEDIYVAVDARTESLQSLRELGPPDLVYLVKQPKANSTRQVRYKRPTFLP